MAKNKSYTMKGTLVRTVDNKWYYTEQQFSADPAYGWHPTVVTAPGQAMTLQQRAEEIAKELRALYDLKS